MHLERRAIYEKPETDELVMQTVIANDVADILAQVAPDALTELLHPFDVSLYHTPCPVFGIRQTGREGLASLLDTIVQGHIGYEILDEEECSHRFDASTASAR